MFVITDKDCIVNLNSVTCIYIKPFTVNGVKGGKIMVQFSEGSDYSDEVCLREYDTYEEAVNNLYDIAIMLEARKI